MDLHIYTYGAKPWKRSHCIARLENHKETIGERDLKPISGSNRSCQPESFFLTTQSIPGGATQILAWATLEDQALTFVATPEQDNSLVLSLTHLSHRNWKVQAFRHTELQLFTCTLQQNKNMNIHDKGQYYDWEISNNKMLHAPRGGPPQGIAS